VCGLGGSARIAEIGENRGEPVPRLPRRVKIFFIAVGGWYL